MQITSQSNRLDSLPADVLLAVHVELRARGSDLQAAESRACPEIVSGHWFRSPAADAPLSACWDAANRKQIYSCKQKQNVSFLPPAAESENNQAAAGILALITH